MVGNWYSKQFCLYGQPQTLMYDSVSEVDITAKVGKWLDDKSHESSQSSNDMSKNVIIYWQKYKKKDHQHK